MTDKTGGPAFPGFDYVSQDGKENPAGMSLRDYFAAKAMQSLIAKLPLFDSVGVNGVQQTREDNSQVYADVSESAYFYADAMITERNKEIK